MKTYKKRMITPVLALIAGVQVASAHTNSVGFKIGSSSITSCVSGGGSTCYDVEVFFGSWHSGNIGAEGQLAIYRIEGGSETQVIGPSATGPGQGSVPFTTSHSLTGTIPNGLTSSSNNYSEPGTSSYNALQSVFDLGNDYFFSGCSELLAAPDNCTNDLYNHQSAVARGLGPGTYRIDYDPATKSSLSATWSANAPVANAVFTISSSGSVVVSDADDPIVSLSAPTTTQSGPFTVTAAFNEDVTGFDISDIVIGNGTASSFVATSATVYTFTVTPDGSTNDVTIDIPAGAAQDSASNPSAQAAQVVVPVPTDTTPPGVTLSGPTGEQSSAFTVTATFDEDVTGFGLDDVVVANAGTSGLTVVSASQYTFTVTPDGSEQDVTIDVPAGSVQDGASNPNTAATQLVVSIADTTPPTVTLAGPTGVQNGTFSVTATFSEDVSGVDLSDIVVGNGSALNLVQVSPSVYTFDVTPGADLGPVSVEIAASAAQDGASNGNVASNQLSVQHDETAPTVVLAGPAAPQNDRFAVTATFSEDVTGVELSDIAVGNGTAENLVAVSASVYTFDVIPDADGAAVTVDFVAGGAADAVGNDNVASNQLSVMHDVTAPTVALSGPGTAQNGQFTVTVTFSEPVSGFEIGDITASNATTANFVTVSASVYTVDIQPDGTNGPIAIEIAADVAIDAANNPNTASNRLEMMFDDTRPTVLLSGPDTPQSGPFTVTATFSEAVTGFTADDVTVTAGTHGNFVTVSASVYTFEVTPDGSGGDMMIAVAENMAMDSASNGNQSAQFAATVSPLLHFGSSEGVLREIIQTEAINALRTSMDANRRMVASARERLAFARSGNEVCANPQDGDDASAQRRPECEDLVTQAYVPFDIDGSAGVTDKNAFLRGGFFGASGGQNGRNRLVYGEFDLTSHNAGVVTGTITGKLAWEKMSGDDTLHGVFVGADLAQSSIDNDFTGSRLGYGVSVGAYVVHAIARDFYAEGFASLGVGQNNLDLENADLEVTGTYSTTTYQVGGAISGEVSFRGVEMRPELGVNYGHTQIGSHEFDATSFGLTETAILDAGSVSLLDVNLTPEFIFPLAGAGAGFDEATLRVAPSLICEVLWADTSQSNCGGGARIAYEAQSDDGLSSVRFEAGIEGVGPSTRHSFALNLERAF